MQFSHGQECIDKFESCITPWREQVVVDPQRINDWHTLRIRSSNHAKLVYEANFSFIALEVPRRRQYIYILCSGKRL